MDNLIIKLEIERNEERVFKMISNSDIKNSRTIKARALAFVYQIKGEGRARCEDNV